jgi:Transglycosylase SLT domain
MPFIASRFSAWLGILVVAGTANTAVAGGTGSLVPGGAAVLDRVSFAVDGAESSHGADPKMWRPEPDGPQGPMQVSAAAAADMGGGDRFDEGENRALGRAYLARMYRRFGSWPDAIAAYNWGPGRMGGWISGGRRVDKFPSAVARYQTRVLLASGLLPADGRAARLALLRLQAKRQLARRSGTDPDEVEVLYTRIMRMTDLGGR